MNTSNEIEEMDEIEKLLLEELDHNNQDNLLSEGDKTILQAESMFIGINEEEKSRRKEIADLKEKIITLKNKLKKCKNIRNPKMVAANAKLADKRIQIKKEIESCKLQLAEIDMETKEYYKK